MSFFDSSNLAVPWDKLGYSDVFKSNSWFKDKYPGFDPWSKENTSPSGPDLSKSSDNKFGEGLRMAGDVLSKWGKDKNNNFGYYGNQGGGMSGGGVQSSGDFTVIYPQQQQPYTIQGSRGFGGPLGTLAGIGASFIPGLGPGIAAAMPAIGGGMGSMFG